MFYVKSDALEFLFDRWGDYRLKPRKRIVPGLWADLQRLLPDYPAPQSLLFWAVVLRLPELNTEEMPTTMVRFFEWCGFDAFAGARTQRMADAFRKYVELTMKGQSVDKAARAALQLPESGELTKKAIQDAYKALAKQHHPDVGGDAAEFQRITAAKDQLMQAV